VANRVLISVLVLHIVLRVLVDCVVGQVHAEVLDVRVGHWLVLLGGESGKAVFVDVNSERVNSEDEDVDTEVEF